MIYTCTLNPAIDLVIETPHMANHTINRTSHSEIFANGKGVNVSYILQMLAIPNTALGIGGGFTLQHIEETLTQKGISHDFVHTKETTRINVFTKVSSTNEEFSLINRGPNVEKEAVNLLLQKIMLLKKGDYLVVSGSLPQGVSPDIFVTIAKLSKENDFHLIIDTSYKEVLELLKYKPFLLKPNDEELAEWFGMDKKLSKEEQISLSQQLIKKGAQNILLSLGKDGAVFMNEKEIFYGNAPTGKIKNTACAGDSLLGAFLAGVIKQKKAKENLAFSIATGSSTAFTSGLTDFSDVEKLLRQIKVEKF